MNKVVVRALVMLGAASVLLGGSGAYSIVRRGLSTRAEPSAVEQVIARSMRSLATPASVRDKANPVEPTTAVLDESLEHFADHCATCHANNGSGATELGSAFYPKSPDMRAAATQDLTDGELFSIIEHGIRLTGMPAWGTGTHEGEQSSWGLVHFIRRLPSLTADEVARMEALNPRSPAQFREEEETRRFLAGDDGAPEVRADPPRPRTRHH